MKNLETPGWLTGLIIIVISVISFNVYYRSKMEVLLTTFDDGQLTFGMGFIFVGFLVYLFILVIFSLISSYIQYKKGISLYSKRYLIAMAILILIIPVSFYVTSLFYPVSTFSSVEACSKIKMEGYQSICAYKLCDTSVSEFYMGSDLSRSKKAECVSSVAAELKNPGICYYVGCKCYFDFYEKNPELKSGSYYEKITKLESDTSCDIIEGFTPSTETQTTCALLNNDRSYCKTLGRVSSSSWMYG